MDPRPFTLREMTALARGRERAEWQRWLPVVCGLSGAKPDEVLPAWLRDDEVRAPAPDPPSEGDNRRGLLLMGRMLGMGEPPKGW